MHRALITCRHLQTHFAALRPRYEELRVEPVLPAFDGQKLDAAAMRAAIEGMDAVIAGDDEIDASVLEAGKASRLKAVIKWGVGADSIDKAAAQRLGVPVYNTPGAFSNEVADLAFSLLLNLVRRTHLMHQSILGGGWDRAEGRTLAGMTAGIVGLGSIGLGIARRAAAFGMAAIGADVRAIPPHDLEPMGARQTSFDELLSRSDVVFLACNLTAENRHLLNADALARTKPGVYLVNVSRGPLIDEPALVQALRSGQVAGAGLDVFETEPLPPDSPLRGFDSCVFSAHAGSSTREAVTRINQMTTDILFHVLGLRELSAFAPNRVA